MRIMALDVGSKRIGVALSDPLKITAQGLRPFSAQRWTKILRVVAAVEGA